MCIHCIEKYVERTERIMLFCDKKQTDDLLANLCICQRYCSEKDRYIPYRQKEQCKEYE